MSEALSDDIISDFVEELKDYIPLLKEKANKLNELTPEFSETDLTELQRLVHAIRGASALIKLNNLSEIAAELETVVEAALSKQLIFNTKVFNTITNTIEYFQAYAKEVPCDDEFNQDLRSRILKSLIDVQKHVSSNDDQDFICKFLDMSEHDDEGPLSFDTDDLLTDDALNLSDHFTLTEDDFTEDAQLSPSLTLEAQEPPASKTEDPLTVAPQSATDEDPPPIELPLEELLDGFYQEADDHLLDLGKAIGELENEITKPTIIKNKNKNLLRLIRRSVHTIKGAAAVVKLNSIASWGHEFENLLEWFYESADLIAPDDVKVIAESADMLEHLVTHPQKVDPARIEQLKIKFKEIISFIPYENNIKKPPSSPKTSQPKEPLLATQDNIDADISSPTIVEPQKTIRVNLTKVNALSNLGGELTIALSAFDKDMEELGDLIGEIDRAQFRLRKTARDLELGYELRAFGKMKSTEAAMADLNIIEDKEPENFGEFDLLELDRYSELDIIIRSLNETASDAGTISGHLSKIYGGFKGYLHHLQILHSQLNQKIMRMQMTPLSTITNRMRSTVRETALQLNKKVQFTIKGEHIELDKAVWEKLAGPLMHLLRNAVDHGIEHQAQRQKAGKQETAAIHLEAAYQGNQVILRISDDGAGIDYEAIRNTIEPQPLGRTSPALSPEELTSIIFQPGFSTRQTVSEVSGRGVGLDVVKENIIELKGNVRVENSEQGVGTTFRISVPITAAITKALIFSAGGQRYAASLHDIKEILRVNPRDLVRKEDNTVSINGRRLTFYNLKEILTSPNIQSDVDESEQWPLVLIIETESWQAAVSIDHMHSQRDIVIKNLGNHLGKVKGIAGATVMGDGQVIPILDLEELLNLKTTPSSKPIRFKLKKKVPKPLEIMIVDDSVTIRNVVSRLMMRQGWKVRTAKDGAEAIEILHTHHPDLVILDIEMPRMNGYEFLSSIRAQKQFSDLPIIMHTSRASKKHREKAETLGANAFVTKPYKENDLIVMIKNLARKN